MSGSAVVEFVGQMTCLVFGLALSWKACEGFGEGLAEADQLNKGQRPYASIRSGAAHVADAVLEVPKRVTKAVTKKAFTKKSQEGSTEEALQARGVSQEQIDECMSVLRQLGATHAEVVT